MGTQISFRLPSSWKGSKNDAQKAWKNSNLLGIHVVMKSEEWGSMNMYERHYCKNKWLDKAHFRFESFVSNNNGQDHCLNFDFHNENS